MGAIRFACAVFVHGLRQIPCSCRISPKFECASQKAGLSRIARWYAVIGRGKISCRMQRDAHVVVGVRIVGVALERLPVGVNRRPDIGLVE